MRTETQLKQIRTHLESGKSITPLEALRQYGCFRLGARIWDLKHLQGMDIRSELVEVDGKRYGKYSINN
jgi:hypothetical protein